jgi:ABC-type uncharacterized transport system involved in gliding motility auxiliary subunit
MQSIFGKRQVRYGTNATVMTLALIAILVLLNILAERNHQRWDLTAEGEFSLSPQTIEIIQNLQQPVEIIGFFGGNQSAQQDDLESRLKEYTSRSDLISYRFIDPDVEPVAARNYNITSYGTVVVESGDQRNQITSAADEQAITSALLKVTQDNPPTVYFLTGHQERSIDGVEQTGYSEAARILQEDNLQVESISLVITDTIPLTNSVLVVADPQTTLQQREQQIIGSYIANGGRLMLLSNPLNPPTLALVLNAVGLAWGNDLLIDEQSELGNPTAPAVVEYPFHPITEDVNGATLYPTVRTIRQGPSPGSATLTELLNSSQNSQAATDFESGEVRLNPDDRQGPLPFGYAVEGVITGTQTLPGTAVSGDNARMVLIGDADFASNTYITLPGTANRDFFRSAISWLAAQEDEFTLPPAPEPVDRSMFLTDNQSQFVFYGSTLGLPLLVIIMGIIVWWQRR